MDILSAFETSCRYRVSEALGVPLARPHWVFVSLSHACNFNCQMCGVKHVLKNEELDRSVCRRVFDEVAGWGTDSVVVLTGGEPFLRPDIFDIVADAVRRGLAIEAVTNGSLIDTEAVAGRVIASGLKNIAISLDGKTAATHDGIRRFPGAYDRALCALRLLSDAKKSAEGGPQISVWVTVMNENLEELADMMPLSAEAGAECLVFHPVIVAQDDMQHTLPRGDLWVRPERLELLRRQIDAMVSYQKKNGLVAFLHDPYLWCDYFRGDLTKKEWRCNPFVFINVGPDGDVRSCGAAFGNVKEMSLEACLNSPQANAARATMTRCFKPCLQTCWSWPGADSLAAAARTFLDRLARSDGSGDQKKIWLAKGLQFLSGCETILSRYEDHRP